LAQIELPVKTRRELVIPYLLNSNPC
jgi:hypothetical protein